MGFLKLFIMVSLPNFFEYGVQGVGFDYANPEDFKHTLSLIEEMKKLGENGTGMDVADLAGRCPYGVNFQKDCNGCYCNPKTGETLCSMMGCELCSHGTKYTIDCNTCVCDKRTGVTRCTRKKCREGTFSNCVHGTYFMKDCNRCRCSMKTGKTTCTSKKCRLSKNKLASKCPHGKYYSPDNGCNTCYCDLVSGVSLCTLVKCYIEKDKLKNKGEQAGKCPHGKHYSGNNDGCKNCYCNPNTSDTRCTKIYCSKKDEFKIVELSKKQLAKHQNLKPEIKAAATGCTPPEVILIGSCRCDCRLPSVAVCKQSCFLDPVG